MEKFENDHKSEYYNIISKELGILLNLLNEFKIEDSDYEALSAKATSEVGEYLRRGLINPLIEARTGLGMESVSDQSMFHDGEKIQAKMNTAQKALAVAKPLQEMFSAFKEVPYLNPEHYERILKEYPGVIKVMTDFVDRLEEGRRRRTKK
jgi:hypothetical protein